MIFKNENGNLKTVLVGVLLTVVVVSIQYLRHSFPFSQTDSIVTEPAVLQQTSGAEHGRTTVAVSSDWINMLNLQTEPVRYETIKQTLRAVATVVPDEERVSHVHTRVAGWIEQLHVSTTGEMVRSGQSLAAIYSRELHASQVEYLAVISRDGTGNSASIVKSARGRLQVLGMSDAEIAGIESKGEPLRLVEITAPRDGVVLRRPVSVGTAVDPSTELLVIADLSQVWVLAEVPESDIPLVAVGMPVSLEFPASGLPQMEASVAFLYPTLSERTRSLRVRIVVPNPTGVLRPGLSGIVQFQIAPRQGLVVPRDAVVDSGESQHVFVRTDTNNFEPRTVRLGARMTTQLEIVEGLAEGEQVVSSGVFLIDSESRLRSSGTAGIGHGGHDVTEDAVVDSPEHIGDQDNQQ